MVMGLYLHFFYIFFSGYDGFPNFYDALVDCIYKRVNSKYDKIDKCGDKLITDITHEKN